ncbi:MAG: hypothetical protein ACKOAR_02405, partial [Bacteroidota bacterium]
SLPDLWRMKKIAIAHPDRHRWSEGKAEGGARLTGFLTHLNGNLQPFLLADVFLCLAPCGDL